VVIQAAFLEYVLSIPLLSIKHDLITYVTLPEKAREVEVSTANFGLNSAAICVPGEDEGSSQLLTRSSRKLAYIPAVSATYSIWYKRRWMQISRTQGQTGWYGRSEDTLQIRWVEFLVTLCCDLG